MQASSFLACYSFSGQLHPSSTEKMFHHHLSCVSIDCSPGADATSASAEDFTFPFPPSLDPVLVSVCRAGEEGGEGRRRVKRRRGEERGSRPCLHTRSGLVSRFALRLGKSFRFSRISCRRRADGMMGDFTQLRERQQNLVLPVNKRTTVFIPRIKCWASWLKISLALPIINTLALPCLFCTSTTRLSEKSPFYMQDY